MEGFLSDPTTGDDSELSLTGEVPSEEVVAVDFSPTDIFVLSLPVSAKHDTLTPKIAAIKIFKSMVPLIEK